MSKIFDALQGTRNEVSDLLPALVAEEADDAPARTMVAAERPVSQEPQTAAPAPAKTAAGPRLAAVPAAGKSRRRVALTVPASAPILPFDDQDGEAAEQYRIVRTKLLHHPRRPRIIVVTSPGTADGKTITAINVAGALSLKAAAKVLLVDVDFRRSSVHALLGLPRSPGLAEVITGECAFEDAVVEAVEYPNLNILPSGEPKVNPSELLESPRWHALCEAVRSQYEYAILDTPPIGAVADCDQIQLAADGVLLVLRPDHTKRGNCNKALESISKEKLVGVLLNCTRQWPLGRHGGYGYGYGYPQLNDGEAAGRKDAARR